MSRSKIFINFFFLLLFTITILLISINLNDLRKTKYRMKVTYDISSIMDLYNYKIINEEYQNTIYVDIQNWMEKGIYKEGFVDIGTDDIDIKFDNTFFSKNLLTFFIDNENINQLDKILDEFSIIFKSQMSKFVKPAQIILNSKYDSSLKDSKLFYDVAEQFFLLNLENIDLDNKMDTIIPFLLLQSQRYTELKTNKIIKKLIDGTSNLEQDIKIVSQSTFVLQTKFNVIIIATFSIIFSIIAYSFIYLVIKNLRAIN